MSKSIEADAWNTSTVTTPEKKCSERFCGQPTFKGKYCKVHHEYHNKVVDKPVKKCTCGSSSVGGPLHSDWCDVADEPIAKQTNVVWDDNDIWFDIFEE